MYSFVKECIPSKPPKSAPPSPPEEVEEEVSKRECKCILDICEEEAEIEEYQFIKYVFENITVTHPPVVKVYYWEYFDLDNLNGRLCSNEPVVNHSFYLPARLLHSRPLKVVFWLRNQDRELTLKVKRVKNCECVHKETRVGFNQYRQLYHCPHRRLVYILQEELHADPNELIALTMTFYFFYAGKNKVTYQLISSDGRLVFLDINFDVDCFFTPEKCVITRCLIPVNIQSYQRFVQPIWVRNLTMCHLSFVFQSNNRGLCVINTNLTVPCQSVWPLMVEYRATDCVNIIDLVMNFESVSTKFTVGAEGVCGNCRINYTCPVLDYECADFLYVIYPNRLEYCMDLNSYRTLVVSVTNFNQDCVEFKWQNYIINDYFAITFEPQKFRLKPHHSKLCMVNVKTFSKVMYFHRIPLILEVHKVLDRATRIAKELLTEIESIDDPKWAQDSYIEHSYLHVDVMIDPPTDSKPLDPPCCPVPPEEISRFTNMKNWCVAPDPSTRNTIFEKLFWAYLAKSDFLKDRECSKDYQTLNYEELLNYSYGEKPEKTVRKVDTRMVYKSLSKLLWNSCIELSKTWRFVPPEQMAAN